MMTDIVTYYLKNVMFRDYTTNLLLIYFFYVHYYKIAGGALWHAPANVLLDRKSYFPSLSFL